MKKTILVMMICLFASANASAGYLWNNDKPTTTERYLWEGGEILEEAHSGH